MRPEPRADGSLYRLAAFTDTPDGGNPAGVWTGDVLPADTVMQDLAAQVGFSETAFLAPLPGNGWRVRYFSPRAEVPFCGHATVAAGAVLGSTRGAGTFQLDAPAGRVPVTVDNRDGLWKSTLTSVDPRHEPAPDALVDAVLAALDWRRDELDPRLPPSRAFAGAWHLVLAASTPERLARLDYDMETLADILRGHDITTPQLVHRERDDLYRSRNPFPTGGVREDPATGAAAAALGGYLRDAGLIEAPARFTVRQGEDMGRPSRIQVEVPAIGGIRVSGTTVPLP